MCTITQMAESGTEKRKDLLWLRKLYLQTWILLSAPKLIHQTKHKFGKLFYTDMNGGQRHRNEIGGCTTAVVS